MRLALILTATFLLPVLVTAQTTSKPMPAQGAAPTEPELTSAIDQLGSFDLETRTQRRTQRAAGDTRDGRSGPRTRRPVAQGRVRAVPRRRAAARARPIRSRRSCASWSPIATTACERSRISGGSIIRIRPSCRRFSPRFRVSVPSSSGLRSREPLRRKAPMPGRGTRSCRSSFEARTFPRRADRSAGRLSRDVRGRIDCRRWPSSTVRSRTTRSRRLERSVTQPRRPTLAALQRSAPPEVQPTISAAFCLLEIDCERQEAYLKQALEFGLKDPDGLPVLRGVVHAARHARGRRPDLGARRADRHGRDRTQTRRVRRSHSVLASSRCDVHRLLLDVLAARTDPANAARALPRSLRHAVGRFRRGAVLRRDSRTRTGRRPRARRADARPSA